jgi:glycerol-3-phosphate acyltransferase PlsX
VRPEHLVQFAHMGAAFMEVVLGVERPRVALLSNGEERPRAPTTWSRRMRS